MTAGITRVCIDDKLAHRAQHPERARIHTCARRIWLLFTFAAATFSPILAVFLITLRAGFRNTKYRNEGTESCGNVIKASSVWGD